MTKTRLLAMASALALFAGPAFAADDNADPGIQENQSSIAYTTFGVDVPLLVQVKLVAQASVLGLVATDMTAPQSVTIPVCVYSNAGTARAYDLTVTGLNADGNSFRAVNQTASKSDKYLDYSVTFTGAGTLSSGILKSMTGADSAFCGAPPFSKELVATFTAANLQAAPEGVYKDQLKIEVAPNNGT